MAGQRVAAYAWEPWPGRHILPNRSPTLKIWLQHNLETVGERIRRAARRSGRDPSTIRLVAVTKTVPAATARALYDLGQQDLAENRIQAALPKIDEVGPGPVWHMIGSVQSNKVRKVVGRFSWIHSVDSEALLERIHRVVVETQVSPPRVLLQVNVSGEASKSGISPQAVPEILSAAGRLASVEVVGLMTIAPLESDPERARPVFRALRALRDQANGEEWYRCPLAHLSMGMSGDLEVAVDEGATLVRVGSALFEPE